MIAREANAPDLWDALWKREGEESWRREALSQVYTRIERLLQPGARVVDVGGGAGLLARRLKERGHQAEVWDHSFEALNQALRAGVDTWHVDLEDPRYFAPPIDGTLPAMDQTFVSTEVLEHLSADARSRLLAHMARSSGGALLSVPNDRLGPDEEPQHTIKFTALEFKRELEQHWQDVRVEVLGPYLLGVCGDAKGYRLSVCLPVRDEAEDLEATLASFRGVADEIIVGVDPRTSDATREIARKYAEIVFDFEDPEGPPDDRVPDGGVHFAWIRNQCLARCSGDWIFMTEGHERLAAGHEVLLSLEQIDPSVKVALVVRSDGAGMNAQQWYFPWLCRNDARIRYTRSTHNTLDYPDGTHVVHLPQVRTLHKRHASRVQARAEQRKVQNRADLMDDWLHRQNENSLYYLASEWREHDQARAERYFRELLARPSKNGAMRYQARLILAKQLGFRGEYAEARKFLLGCAEEDWSRTEHYIWLGDLAFRQDQLEEALQWYLLGATRLGDPPFTLWWIDVNHYTYLPAQRLAMCFAELGRVDTSLEWARRVVDMLPDDAPFEVLEESRAVVRQLEEAINAE